MSRLLTAQQEFTRRVPKLLEKAIELGFDVTLGDAYRDPRVDYGSKSSKHCRRLALDLNLFKDGEYVTQTEGHRVLGEWWESIGGVWGGTFPREDGNHYESPYPGAWHDYKEVITKPKARR